MRKLALAAALASTALATPALARDKSWYVGAETGGMIVEDLDFDFDDGSASTVDMDTGVDVGGQIGYDFGAFRLETEVAYKRAEVDGGSDDATSLSFMVNGLLDFGPDDGLQGFVGGGAGVARTKFSGLDSDTGFAWQAIAGIRAPLTDHWDVSVKYRFYNHGNIDLVVPDGTAASTRFRSHSLLGGITYNFGEPPAPPPPPPPPPPPEPPPDPGGLASCSAFFRASSIALRISSAFSSFSYSNIVRSRMNEPS